MPLPSVILFSVFRAEEDEQKLKPATGSDHRGDWGSACEMLRSLPCNSGWTDSLHRSGWSRTQRPTSFCNPSTEIKGMRHHTWPRNCGFAWHLTARKQEATLLLKELEENSGSQHMALGTKGVDQTLWGLRTSRLPQPLGGHIRKPL